MNPVTRTVNKRIKLSPAAFRGQFLAAQNLILGDAAKHLLHELLPTRDLARLSLANSATRKSLRGAPARCGPELTPVKLRTLFPRTGYYWKLVEATVSGPGYLDCPWLEKLTWRECDDVSNLAQCHGLHTLDLSYCKGVTDLGGLAHRSLLHTLDLSGCRGVTDVSILAQCSKLHRRDQRERLGPYRECN